MIPVRSCTKSIIAVIMGMFFFLTRAVRLGGLPYYITHLLCPALMVGGDADLNKCFPRPPSKIRLYLSVRGRSPVIIVCRGLALFSLENMIRNGSFRETWWACLPSSLKKDLRDTKLCPEQSHSASPVYCSKNGQLIGQNMCTKKWTKKWTINWTKHVYQKMDQNMEINIHNLKNKSLK